MTFSVTMPALGESVTEGTVTRWLKKEGDVVAVDEPLLEVSTDKVDTEIPSPVAGVLQKIVVAVDSTVAVGAELAVIADSAGATSTPAPVAAPVVEKPAPAPVAAAVVEKPTPAPIAPSAPGAPAAASGSTIVSMPALGESVTEGTVTRWLKKVGDPINVDEPLLEVSTDKVDTEIPSPATGTVLTIDVAVDATVAVGARLASIGVSSGAPVATPAPAAPVTPVAVPVTPVAAPVVVTPPIVAAPVAPVAQQAAVQNTRNDDSYVTPIVRKLAAESGVNLATIKGTGVGGRIRKEDILAAAPRVAASPTLSAVTSAASSTPANRAPIAVSPLRGTTVNMTRLRKVIADRMVESLKISAQLTTVIEVD
ncbi:MAG: 2-oxoglutarate dehydrogenase, E2 component, dihydrolipoamide succinyltransferase, partial [Actinobacteria bacterium]|nr:2-oxoglutarate dehydrogenase, E2 component, dihydrolipoamide succinyltransferase [Actinomycetota bacterium]